MVTYFRRSKDRCPTIRVKDGKVGIADPCRIIPHSRWFEYCDYVMSVLHDFPKWTKVTFGGLDFEIRSTGGDGIFMGVAVDTGTLIRFQLNEAQKVFGFEMIPCEEGVDLAAWQFSNS